LAAGSAQTATEYKEEHTDTRNDLGSSGFAMQQRAKWTATVCAMPLTIFWSWTRGTFWKKRINVNNSQSTDISGTALS